MRFFIVDAFTDTLFGGNPAGVVMIGGNSDFPCLETMRKTAAELRYSETAFIKRTSEDSFATKYFTPAEEVDLCGHATIGTFSALSYAGIIQKNRVYKNSTQAGELNIEVSDSILMDMAAPEALDKIENGEALNELYSIMGLSYEKRHTAGGKYLPEMISTGIPDILMPVADEDSLNAISPDFKALAEMSKKYSVVGVHAFTLNAEDGNIHCRNFAPLYAIDEEAATGTSNGALTYYLFKNGVITGGAETLFIQGEAMNRPSKIISRIKELDGGVKIQVGGSAVVLADGEINL